MNRYKDYAVNKNFQKLRLRFKFSNLDFSKFLNINVKSLGAYEECRAQVPIEIVKQLVDRGLVGKRDLYSFLFDPDFKHELKPTKKKK